MESEDIVTRPLKSQIRDGQIWLKYCHDCGEPASENQAENEPCEFCGCPAVIWQPSLKFGSSKPRPDILRGGLSPHQREIGLRLSVAPAASEVLNLIYQGRVQETFPYRTVTIPDIQEAACRIEEGVS